MLRTPCKRTSLPTTTGECLPCSHALFNIRSTNHSSNQSIILHLCGFETLRGQCHYNNICVCIVLYLTNQSTDNLNNQLLTPLINLSPHQSTNLSPHQSTDQFYAMPQVHLPERQRHGVEALARQDDRVHISHWIGCRQGEGCSRGRMWVCVTACMFGCATG